MNQILIGDCKELLKTIPDQTAHCCVTSPPYYGLRDYGIDGQIGLEQSPEAYVAELVEVFREVWRVLRDDGTVWLNLGDCYARAGGTTDNTALTRRRELAHCNKEQIRMTKPPENLGPKNLLGIPWRVAFALQAEGWYLRSDIIWHKPNPMPESVTDRPTKSHEYIFLLSKSERYYYDYEAIKEPAVTTRPDILEFGPRPDKGFTGHMNDRRRRKKTDSPIKVVGEVPKTRNKRDVWIVATQGSTIPHFAMFPEKLIEPCILAGCPEGGIVLDPFFGAGTTGVVAAKTGRNCIGIELNPTYAEIAERRVFEAAGLFGA
jgi:DNA modification methylase